MLESRFILAQSHLNFAQEAVVDVDHAPPGDGGFVDVEAGKARAFFGRQVVGVGLVDAEFLQRRSMVGENLRLPFLSMGQSALNIFSSSCMFFVHHARIQRGGHQVVRGGDGVDVARQVQVEIFHRDDLRIPAARRAALDAKGRSLRRLADGGDDLLAEVRAQRLRKPTVVVVLPSPSGVGVMAVTSTYLPFGLVL
jgi:hypothetical protein